MHSAMQRRLLHGAVRRACGLRPCRVVAGRRFPPLDVNRSSPFLRLYSSTPRDDRPVDSPLGGNAPGRDLTTGEHREAAPASEHVDDTHKADDDGLEKSASPYGSASRRASRNRRYVRSANSSLPAWFYERNVSTHNGAANAEQECGVWIKSPDQDEKREDFQDVTHGGEGNDGDPANGGGRSPDGDSYVLNQAVWDELQASVRAGLQVPAARYMDDPCVLKAHLILQYPGDGGAVFLDSVTRRLSRAVGADLVTINAQDVAELDVQASKDSKDDVSPSFMAEMGYKTYQAPVNEVDEADEEMEDDVFEMEDDETGSGRLPESRRKPGNGGPTSLWDILNDRGTVTIANLRRGNNPRSDNSIERVSSQAFVGRILSSPEKHREQESMEAESEHRRTDQPKDLIIQVQDYLDLKQAKAGGFPFLAVLHREVRERREMGRRILIIGTVSSRRPDISPGRSYPRLAQNALEADYIDDFSKTIVVTPAMDAKDVDRKFSQDQKMRTFEINIRHIQMMLKIRLGRKAVSESELNQRRWNLSENMVNMTGLKDGYWSFNRVHRAVTLIHGLVDASGYLGLAEVERTLELMEQSDRVKGDWMIGKYPKARSSSQSTESQSGPSQESRIKQLRKSANTHEQKLLSGVVDADSIHTTFDDVHALNETKDALRMLTSLSLERPDAFTYGVLATDKIPGLLLYGPPGTGKTLLAKAVAKQSGATVLEVSGSDVYDMYVGEGEKNVRAIFTLAKKLSPCVVFIDEADAIFCSRVSASNRGTHRELINQFLREWDGMADTSAFIMVATNRPFDLDDAVLRRLPRRLLVDLPTDADRTAILKIHLRNERLDPTVDLAALARATPLYSGSDLKNMCVAAALAAVREENDMAAAHTGPEPFQFPERRTLRPHHFSRAMEEISASISEDMSSLTAIKKFDEKYGDRKGRRKKGQSWGFNVGDEKTETGRVRN